LSEKQQLDDRARIISDHKAREKERAARKLADPKVYNFTVARASQPGLPAPTNTLSSIEDEFGGLIPIHTDTGDELADAVTSESEHAETAKLEEAENILVDYIELMKEGPNKHDAPMLAN